MSIARLLVLMSLFPVFIPSVRAAEPVPGCKFDPIDVSKYGNQPFQNPPEARAINGVLQTTLGVMFTDPARISIGGCPVKLRSYNGQLVGPTMRIRPGDVMHIVLDNRLPVESPDEIAAQISQEASNAFIETRPHSFNTTNLHTHGLHVSPAANSDNVLLAIAPKTKFPYEIRVPGNHPPGSFWYHAHAHGSTAVQVGSGMAGALIIEDDEAKIPAALREANKHEKVMVIQTTLYDAQGEVKDITAFFPPGVDDEKNCAAQKPNCSWPGSNRRVTINGQIVPVITMRPGEVQRWRLIDSAFRESFNLQLEGHVLHEIALDGLYLGHIDDWDGTSINRTVELQPGYRSDVLVKASMTPGDYQLIDAAVSAGSAPAPACPAQSQAAETVSATRAIPRAFAAAPAGPPATIAGAVRNSLLGVDEAQSVIALVRVAGEPIDMKLPTNAEMAALAPFPGVNLESQADGVQQATFKLGSGYDPKDQRNSFQINFRAFNPAHVRTVRLNHTDVWTLTTVGDPPCVPRRPSDSKKNPIPPLTHVFHIHVNPFQTTRLDPTGKPEVVWKDTLLVPPAAQLRLFTQYLDYIGQFVMHCHILDHEDLGMMEIVEVVPDAAPSSLPAHGTH